MDSERKTQYLQYLSGLYQVFLQAVRILLYCAKYICFALTSIFTWMTTFFDGAIEALEQEITTVRGGGRLSGD